MEPLPPTDVRKTIRDIAEFGEVILTQHASDQMKVRNYSMSDVLTILKNGEIVNTEQLASCCKYTIQGEDVDGEGGAVVTVIQDHRSLVIITVLGGIA